MSERKRVARIFKMRGLSVQSSALDALLNVLSREGEQQQGGGGRRSTTTANDTLLAIIDEVKERMISGDGRRGGHRGGNSNVVTTALLEEVVADLSRDAKDVTDEALQLLDAFRTPRLEYDSMRKAFSLEDFVSKGKGRALCGEAVDKVRSRWALFSCPRNAHPPQKRDVTSSLYIVAGGYVRAAVRPHPAEDTPPGHLPAKARHGPSR